MISSGAPAFTAASRTILAAWIVEFFARGCGEMMIPFLVFNEISVLKGLKALKDAGEIKKIIVLVNAANQIQTTYLATRGPVETKINYIQNNRTLLNGKEIDILFPSINKCIEVQGTYWHCDPRFYDGNYLHKVKNKTASEIWEYDLSKKLLIESKKLQVLYIWEYDWDNNTNSVKLQIKEFLK